MKVKESGSLVEARNAFEGFVAQNSDSPRIDEARDELGAINMELFYSDAPDPGKEQYVIQKGDTISAIEKKTKVPGELIMRLNKIDDPTKLRIGEVLNVSRPEFALQVHRKTQTVVMLFNNGKVFQAIQGRAVERTAASKNPDADISAKVTEKSAWKDNQRVSFGAKDYNESGHWITMNAAGYTLYSEGVDGVPKPVGGGLGMKAEDIQELSTLINKGTPITIE